MGSHVRLVDSCITQLMAEENSRTCNESNGEEEDKKLSRICAAIFVDSRGIS